MGERRCPNTYFQTVEKKTPKPPNPASSLEISWSSKKKKDVNENETIDEDLDDENKAGGGKGKGAEKTKAKDEVRYHLEDLYFIELIDQMTIPAEKSGTYFKVMQSGRDETE